MPARLRDPFLAEVYTGIRLACNDLHYDFVVHGDIEGKTAKENKLKLSDGKVGGLVVHAPPGDPVVASLVGGDLPAVAIADRQLSFPSLVRQIGGEELPDLTVFPVSLVEGDTA